MAKYTSPLGTGLDADQTITRAYDEVNNRHRVDAQVSAVIGSVDVIIDAASGDNIAIQDSGGDELEINGDGSINVIVQDITLSKDNDSIEVFQASHDNLNVNANVQQNNTDVGAANPLYTQTTNGSLETTQQQVKTELQSANTSLDNIEAYSLSTKNAVQSIDTDFDVALSTRASEATQALVHTELVTANSSLDAIEVDVEAIRLQAIDINSELDSQTTLLTNIDQSTNDIEVATESINTKFDTNLSTRSTEATQLQVLGELQATNTSLDNIESDVDAIRIAVQSVDSDIDVALSTRASEATLSNINTKLNSLGQKSSTGSVPVVIASDQSSIPVSAVDLDIRDLAFAQDKVDVSGSSVSVSNFPTTQNVAITSSVELEIKNDISNPIPVTGTFTTTPSGTQDVNIVSSVELEISNSVNNPIPVSGTVTLDSGTLSALENITVQNGAGSAAVNVQDGGNSITVDAINLDIRDLTFATDKVDVSGSTITTTPSGTQDVNIISSVILDTTGSVVALDSTTLAALETTSTANGALETTQQSVLSELQTIDTSLDAIEIDAEDIKLQTIDINSELDAQTVLLTNIDQSTNDIETAVESINTKIDVNLSTVSTEATQLLNNAELVDINTELDSQTTLLTSIDTKLTSPIITSVNNFPAVQPVSDNGGSLTVDAVDLDIRNLTFAQDKVDASGSSVSISNFPTTQDVNITSSVDLTVQATNLDIRNLAFAQDKVDASGSVIGLDSTTLAALENTSTINGALEVTQLQLLNSKAIDKTYTSLKVDTKNDDGNPTQITIKNGLTTVRTLTISYDADGDFEELVKS